MDYFDDAYFDPAYFDTAEAPATETPGHYRPRPRLQPVPEPVGDDEADFLMLFT